MLVMGTLYFSATAQCGKNLVLKSSKTERLDKDGNVVDSRSEDVTVNITATSITIVPGDDHMMEGRSSLILVIGRYPLRKENRRSRPSSMIGVK